MTPNARAKQLGTTTKEAAEQFGCTVQNLTAIRRKHPERFDIICMGVVEYKKQAKND